MIFQTHHDQEQHNYNTNTIRSKANKITKPITCTPSPATQKAKVVHYTQVKQ